MNDHHRHHEPDFIQLSSTHCPPREYGRYHEEAGSPMDSDSGVDSGTFAGEGSEEPEFYVLNPNGDTAHTRDASLSHQRYSRRGGGTFGAEASRPLPPFPPSRWAPGETSQYPDNPFMFEGENRAPPSLLCERATHRIPPRANDSLQFLDIMLQERQDETLRTLSGILDRYGLLVISAQELHTLEEASDALRRSKEQVAATIWERDTAHEKARQLEHLVKALESSLARTQHSVGMAMETLEDVQSQSHIPPHCVPPLYTVSRDDPWDKAVRREQGTTSQNLPYTTFKETSPSASSSSGTRSWTLSHHSGTVARAGSFADVDAEGDAAMEGQTLL